MIGQTISHYKIIEKLGEGGMGVVYKARDTRLDRDLALKFLPPELTKDPEAKERFIHEAKATSVLQHANICTVHDIDESPDGQIFIVMDLYEGETLKKKIEQGPLKIDHAVDIAVQLAQGLTKAHEKSIVHRDIKPANIFITTDGVVKILDFGLAKLRGLPRITKTGSTLGTAPYMSPEQARGEAVDHRTDIWSLGVLLYEMITGQLPFRGDYEQAITYQIINATPEPMTGIRTGVPVELDRIVGKCLEKETGERYQTAADLIADLRHLERISGHVVHQPSATPPKSGSLLKRLAIVTGILVVAVALILIFRPFSVEPQQNKKSIAVLPFRNMSDSKEDEYFSDGLTEDIITQLSKISGIEKVIARTSVMQYKSGNKSIHDIGRELDVNTILEGSVRRSDNRVRIVAQLIDVRSEGHMWAETYDKEKTQIFEIQSDVAQKIATALKTQLLPSEKAGIQKQPTADLTAYDYYLKGREYYYRYRKEDNETAIVLFKKAIALDTNYSLALAGLADAYAQRTDLFGQSASWLDSSIAISLRAIAKDEHSAEAYKALGVAYEYKGYFHKALDANRKALEFNPNYMPAIANIGDENVLMGKYTEWYKWRKKALSLNPTLPMNYAVLAREFYWLTDGIDGDKYNTRALELQPDLAYAVYNLYFWHLWNMRFLDASKDTEKQLSLDRDTAGYDNRLWWISWCSRNFEQARTIAYKRAAHGDSGYLPRIYWRDGRKDEARKFFRSWIDRRKKIIDEGDEDPNNVHVISRFYAIMEEKTEALRWLRKAVDAGWNWYMDVLPNPDWDSIRDTEEFKKLIAEVKANVEAQKKIVREMEEAEENQ